MKNWLKEILEEFKSLSIEERIERLNRGSEHEIIQTMEAVQRTIADNFMVHVDLINFTLAPSFSGALEVEADDFIAFVLECSAANDERFALAA